MLLTYPEKNFPPTCDHVMVQAGTDLYMIGNAHSYRADWNGLQEERPERASTFQVLRTDLETYSVQQLQCNNSPPHGIVIADVAVEVEVDPILLIPWSRKCLSYYRITASNLELQPGMRLAWADAVEFQGMCCHRAHCAVYYNGNYFGKLVGGIR